MYSFLSNFVIANRKKMISFFPLIDKSIDFTGTSVFKMKVFTSFFFFCDTENKKY